ncbi:MAG: hypothetical protein OEW77_03220 [Gemmatimonadota bacterium]|nr:hypothetical protein [Gemmatimonadota bacterium]
MTVSERATAGSVRSAHVAHFLPPDWSRVARATAPAFERVAKDADRPQLLVIVPDALATLGFARAVATLPAAAGLRVVAATSPARAKRLLATGPTQVVVGSCGALAPALIASVLKLDGVATVLFAAADELDADDADLAAVMAEVPRTAARVLTALAPTPGVEALLERYLHRARRVTEDAAPDADAATVPVVKYLAVRGTPLEALPTVLDEMDAPSATIVAADPRAVTETRTLLAALGYRDETLATVTTDTVAPNTSLVVLLGVPAAPVWAAVVAAQPSTVAAIISSRELPALRQLAGATEPQPFAGKTAVLRARAADARVRAELRETLAEGVPTREVLVLEPLLGEHDGLEIAAAALRLLERTRAAQAELVRTAEVRVRTVMQEAQRSREAEGAGDRPPRPRPFSPRGEKPKGFGPRGDKPRGPRRDDDRGPRGPRGPR